jgi:hypothetical protein
MIPLALRGNPESVKFHRISSNRRKLLPGFPGLSQPPGLLEEGALKL